MLNRTYILEEYEKRCLLSLLAEYARLDCYITNILDFEGKCIDDDTNERYDCVKQVICEKILESYGDMLTSGTFCVFKYFE